MYTGLSAACRELNIKIQCQSSLFSVCLRVASAQTDSALHIILKFVCHYWQWPILITCEKCYRLCVLRWRIRPILALNSLLHVEQQRPEQDSSVGDALPLALRCARFCSASLILFASYSLAPLLMRLRHFARSCAICSLDSFGMLKFSREALRVSLYRFSCPPWERLPIPSSP